MALPASRGALDTPSLHARAAYGAIADVGWLSLGGAGVGAGLMATGASLVALRTKAVATWVGWLGVAAGVASFATITFLGSFAWLGGILIVSVASSREAGAAPDLTTR